MATSPSSSTVMTSTTSPTTKSSRETDPDRRSLTASSIHSSTTETSNSTTTSDSTDQAHKQEEARAAILATLESAGSGQYDAQFQRRAIDLHANAAALEKQDRQVRTSAAALAKESTKWQKEVDRMTKGLNDFGDLENWAEMLDNDLLVLEETLRLVERRAERTDANEIRPWHVDDYEIR